MADDKENEVYDPEEVLAEPDEDTEDDGFAEPEDGFANDTALDPELPRVIVAASSSWTNHATIERELFNWWNANGMIPVHVQIGDCPIGGEPMARETLMSFGLPVTTWNADTITPLQRDRAMVAAGADVAFIFIEEDSFGASRMRDLCIGAGIPTIVCTRSTVKPFRRYESQ